MQRLYIYMYVYIYIYIYIYIHTYILTYIYAATEIWDKDRCDKGFWDRRIRKDRHPSRLRSKGPKSVADRPAFLASERSRTSCLFPNWH
jgi:hypothetical protein